MRGLMKCLMIGTLFGLLPAVASGQDSFFDSQGVRIRYIDRGTGVPVVLVHGFASVADRVWIETGVLPNLAKDHRVIALDLRGHGKSDKPHDQKAYSQPGQDVIRLLDHLGIARAHIVGYSLGGAITAKLLTTNPDRFITATLGGSSGWRSWTPQDERDAEAVAVELEHGGPYRALILNTWPTDQPLPTDEAIRKRSQEISAMNDPLALAAFVRARRDLVVTNAQMAAVPVPTLAVVGSLDPALSGVKALKAVWPALKVVVIQGATHGNNNGRGAATSPEFINAVREFMAAHTVTSSR
jgi:pimeloyl-ACP methyl ester carboxylesterase